MAAERRTILHVDMDAFFAAIEQRDRPELRGRPIAVGALPEERGVVATASYEARRFGIHSAMASRTAARRCPELVFVPPRHAHYEAVSRQVMAILSAETPEIEPVSIDEAFLDLTRCLTAPEEAVVMARRIKDRLRHELGLTGSAGIGPNKFLAKLASDLHKPDGLAVIPSAPDAVRDVLAPLPVSRIWGVGPATAALLGRRGLRRIGDVQRRPVSDLVRILGPALGHHVHSLAFGRDDRPVVSGPQEEQSLSHEETFARDISDRGELRRCLLELVEKVGRRLRRSGRLATSAHLKLRFADFRTVTRQQTLPGATHADRDLLRCAAAILDRVDLPQAVRLIGFGVGGLCGSVDGVEPRQLLLFDDPHQAEAERNAALDHAVDELRARYGDGILKRRRW